VFFVLGRLVSLQLQHDRRSVTKLTQTASPEKPHWPERPESVTARRHRAFSSLPIWVVAGVITVALSGLVSFLVADRTSHEQGQDEARLAVSSQETQELLRMQRSADLVDQDSQRVGISAFRCSAGGKKWTACVSAAPDYFRLLADSSAFGSVTDPAADPQAASLAGELSANVNAFMASRTARAGIQDLGNILNAQIALDQRFSLVIKQH
jgi:hypothetical protein